MVSDIYVQHLYDEMMGRYTAFHSYALEYLKAHGYIHPLTLSLSRDLITPKSSFHDV